MKYISTRLFRSLLTLIIVVTVVFLLMRMMPIEGYFGANFDKLDEAQKTVKLQNLGLLDPWYTQLKNFYTDLLKGNLGESINRYKSF